MSCPDIYIAPSYRTTPHAGDCNNTAIDVGPDGTTFVRDVTRTIQVTVRNHGTDNSPASHLELHWADPSSSFLLKGLIGEYYDLIIDGNDGISTDGSLARNFSWTPNSTVVGTNGGHVCLLAQVENTSSPDDPACSAQGHLASSSAPIDARSAVRNIHVVNPTKKMKADIPGGRPDGMNFAFAAADAAAHREETHLIVKPLDPKADRERLHLLAGDPAVYHALAHRRGKFAMPEDVLVAEGTERVVLPRPRIVVRKKKDLRGIPRIGHLGALENQVAARLLPHGTKLVDARKPLPLHLVPGEMRQVIVHVVPRKDDAFYAVSVDHVGAKGRVVGGLVMIFIPPPDLSYLF